jgi:hypothetical protein
MPILEKVTLITNCVLAAVAIVTFIVIYCQFKEMKNSARLDQRAWVGVVGINGTPKLNEPFIVTVEGKNTGKTFAKKLRGHIYFQSINANEKPDFSQDDSRRASDTQSVSLVAPNGDYQLQTNVFAQPEMQTVTQGRLDDWKSGKKIFLAAGKIFYEDIFHCEHWTTFCFYLRRDLQGYFNHEQHNDADENQCP